MTSEDSNPVEPTPEDLPRSAGFESVTRDHAIVTQRQIRAFCLHLMHQPTICEGLGLDLAEVERVARHCDNIEGSTAIAGFDFAAIPLGVPLGEPPESGNDATQPFLFDPLSPGTEP